MAKLYIATSVYNGNDKEDIINRIKKVKQARAIFGEERCGQKKYPYIRVHLQLLSCTRVKCRTCGKNHTKSKNKSKGNKKTHVRNIMDDIKYYDNFIY